MTPGDAALERIIAELTTAIAMTADPRLVRLQTAAVGMRSGEQVRRMERSQGLSDDARRAAYRVKWGRR